MGMTALIMKSEIILLNYYGLSLPIAFSRLRENSCEIIPIFTKVDPQICSEKYLERKVFTFFPQLTTIQKKS